MKIVHIAPNAPYNNNWGYQENLLPKYQKKLGHDVTLIITNLMHTDGKIVETDCDDYTLDDGVRVIRVKKKKYPSRILTNLNSRLDVFGYLVKIMPDFVFCHGLVSTTIHDVVRYKKHINSHCTIVQDNHQDYYNSPVVLSIKNKLFRAFYRYTNKAAMPYVSRVYGVTPWRQKYAEDFFGISPDKTDVLIMGADDEKINFKNRETIRSEIRKKYHISDSDFFIVTGGKIDKNKKIDLLMQACSNLNGVKLLVFGTVLKDVKEQFEAILHCSENITYIGWLNADKVYDFFMSADLVCFPGTHSVMWEQACACKVPCLFEKWEGMEHVNNGGNSAFVSPVTEETLRKKISELHYTDKYFEMKRVADSEATDVYLYSNIAKKSLECAKEI